MSMDDWDIIYENEVERRKHKFPIEDGINVLFLILTFFIVLFLWRRS